MNSPSQLGIIRFYDAFEEDVAEVAIRQVILEPGNPPVLVLIGDLFAAARLPLTPDNLRHLRALLEDAAATPTTDHPSSQPITGPS